MSAAALIAEAAAAGVTLVRIGDDRLKWTCARPPPPSLLERLKANKLDVLAALRSADWFGPDSPLEVAPTRAHAADCASSATADAIAERAAIAEIDGGLPRGWAEALAEVTHTRPAGIAAPAWESRVAAVCAFADLHAAALNAAGWTFGEVFGVGPNWWRLDQRGAGWFIGDAAEIEITPDCLRWRTPDGASHTLWRAGRGPHVWGAP